MDEQDLDDAMRVLAEELLNDDDSWVDFEDED